MNSIIPLYEEGISWSDSQLEENFRNKAGRGRVQLTGLVAQRSSENEVFLDLLKTEAISEENREKIFFGFIKFSWIPVIAVLEYGSVESKEALGEWLLNWTSKERQDFFDYISKETEFLSWFSKIA